MRGGSDKQAGLSLLEILIVVTILGVVAAVAIPSFSSIDPKKLDLAATEVANAVRFARREAMRTGVAHGVHAEVSPQRLRVYRLDSSGGTPTPTYDVRHPVDKKVLSLLFAKDRTLAGVELAGVTFKFSGYAAAVEYLVFDATGTPRYDDGTTIYMLETALLLLSDGSQQRAVSVDPMTGRVTVN